MKTTRESPEETRAQYLTCKGWIRAGQLERAERFMQLHGLIVGGAGA